MTVELFFSNQLEHLTEKLARNLSGEHARIDDPFLPLKIIVPNNNLAKWITLMLARRESIMMNVDFQFLETGLWEMLASLDSTLPPAEMLDKSRSRLLVLSVLSRLKKDDPDLVPVVGYLFDSEGQKHPDYLLRLWQLADRLAGLFQEYEYHRTDMIRKWLAGEKETDDLARCERRIYLSALEARIAAADACEKPVLSLMEYADRVLPKAVRPEKAPDVDRPIHFFGLSQVSSFHLSVIDRLQPFFDMCIYALNPSCEFWEDIRTPAEKRWINHQKPELSIQDTEMDEGELFDDRDHPLLSAWGKPGRESVRLLCRLTDYSFNAGFSPVDNVDTVLKQVQNDILTLGSFTPPTHLSQDRSLQIYGCPGPQREVETVYHNILFNLSRDGQLKLTDIAVLVPDITVYKPVFDLVFHRRPKRLTYNLIDSRADIESVYGQAILGLLTLATERFSRKAVFELILNPCFRHKWRIETDDVRLWAKWAESLNIFHSFERRGSSLPDTPHSGRYTWKQGLQRLRLARIFSGHAGGDGDSIHFDNLVPFTDTDTGDTDLVEKFCLVVETLARMVDALHLLKGSAARWQTSLLNMSRELLSIPPDYRGEAAIRQNLFQALDELTFFDRLHSSEDLPIFDVSLMAEYLRFRLGAISGGSGDYLTGGVTVSELQPMRPIPFKIIYVLGMEEGNFPGRVDTSMLDLRRKKRWIGDISLPDRNRYLFLETLLAAREKLYISYILRDLQKDRLLQPCNVVNQLKHHIEEKVLPGNEMFRMGTVPLKGSSVKYLKPDAVTFWSDVRVSYDLADRVACYQAAGLWSKVQAGIGENERPWVARLNPDLSIPPETLPYHSGTDDQIQLWRLKRFLLQPLEENSRRHLGLFREETGLEDLVQMEDEPFFSEFPLDWRLKVLPLHHWLDTIFDCPDSGGDRPSLDRIFNHFYADFHRRSATPEGMFAQIDRASLRESLSQLEAMIVPLVDRMHSADTSLKAAIIGTPAEPAGTLNRHNTAGFDPIEMPVSVTVPDGHPMPGRVQLHGQLRWLWYEKETGWHVLVPAVVMRAPKRQNKYVLEAALFYLSCLCGDPLRKWSGETPLTIHLVTTKKTDAYTFQADKSEAENYLSHLFSEYLDPKNRFWLPFEIVAGCAVNPLDLDREDIDDARRAVFRDETIEAFEEYAGELDQLIAPEFPNDLLDRAVNRFRIFGKIRPLVFKNK